MRQWLIRRPGRAAAVYEVTVAALGWSLLLWASVRAHQPAQALPVLLFLLLAVALKREGFRVAYLVTHSLAGIAVLAALIALGPVGGAWVATLSGLLLLASRFPGSDRRTGLDRWRLALFGGGLNAMAAMAGGALYSAFGGRWAPASLTWADILPLAALSLAWFTGDHLGWSLRIALEERLSGLSRFWRAILFYSVVVELLPLPLAFVVAAAYSTLGALSFGLLAVFLVAVGEVLRRLNLTLNRAHERVADLTMLNTFSRDLLASKLDVIEFCRLLHSHTAAIVDARRFWLGLFNPHHGRLEPVLAFADSPGGAAPDPALLDWMQKHRVPLLIRDSERDGLPYAAEAKPAARSALYVPLQATGMLLGLLAVESPEPDAYGEDDLRTIVTFANQTAIAIQNARSYEAEQRRSRQIATVSEVSRRVVAIMGMEQLFAEVVRLIRDAFGYYHVQLFTADPATGELTFRASTSPTIQATGIDVAPGQGLIGWAAQTRERVASNDITAEPRYRLIPGLEDAHAEMVVPLKVDERLVGILDVLSAQPDAFGEDDLAVIQTLAEQVAIAIEDNRLYRAEKARRQLADTLREVASALNSTLQPRAVLDLVLTQLWRVIRYDAAAILEWRDDHYCIVAGRGPKYADPDRCLTRAEDAQLRKLTVQPAPFVFGTEATLADGDALPSLAAPLLVKEHLIGALILERQGPQAHYSEEEIQIVQAFADQAAVAIENAQLYQAAQRRARQLATIAEVGQRVASILDLDELFVQVVHLVRNEFGYYHVSLFTIEPESGALTFRATTNLANQEHGFSTRLGEGIIGWVAAHGESLLANDVLQEPRYQADAYLPNTQSEMAVPLRVEGHTVGVLDIQGDRPDAFGPEDLFIAQTLADQVAVAVENTRLYAGQQEEAWVSTALLQVAETLANLIGIDEVLDAVIRLVPLLVGVDRCFIFQHNEDTGEYRVARAHGLAGAEREACLGQTLENLAPDLWQALQQNPQPPALDIDQPEPAQSASGIAHGVGLPLRAGGETIGWLVAGNIQPGDHLNRNRRAILTGIANQAGMAIQNAHLYIAQREEAWVSTALLQISELAGRTRDLDEILAAVVRLTPMLVGVDRCCVFLWDRDTRRYTPAQAYGLDEGLKERFRDLAYAEGDLALLDRVRETGEPLSVEDAAGSGLVPAAVAQDLGIVSVLALPLRSQAEVMGIMLVDYAGRPYRFSKRRIALLSGIANQAAVAIENAHLYRESLERVRIAQELRVAHQIQVTFLPESCPTLPGWSIAATSQAAREIGGDFYDFIPLGAHRLGLVIADVSDKGVPAALFMVLSRSITRAVAVEGRSPAATLSRVNELLLADARSGMFVTLFYGILDSRSGEMIFASAGHNPPYHYRCQDGELVRLVRHGIALGVIEHPTFEEGRIKLQHGDALVLYSDGVTDSFNSDEVAFGEDGLRAAIRQAGCPSAGQPVIDAINRAVQDFVHGAPQFDDYTLLVVTRESPGESAQ